MDAFGQLGASFQPGYSYTQAIGDMAVYAGDHFNVHQQNLHQTLRPSSVYGVTSHPEPTVNPYCRFGGGSAINPSYLYGNGAGYLPSGHANSQDLTPARCKMVEMPSLPYQNHGPTIQTKRPCYSYSALIFMALQSAPKKKLLLCEIYSYIANTFPFYNRKKSGWQNSIRHNLSLNKCFKKLAREEDNTGKGCYWTIDPNCDKTLIDGNFRRQLKPINKGEPSKMLDDKVNMRSDSLAGSPAKEMNSPLLVTTRSSFTNFTSPVISMSSHGASTRLRSTSHPPNAISLITPWTTTNSVMPVESTSQVNPLQALALPNQCEEPVLFSHQPSTYKPNAF